MNEMTDKESEETQESSAQVGAEASESRRGLLIVYTGNGKGKTTAALGMALRAVGYGWPICIIQFVKGSWKYGELEGLKRLRPEVELKVAGAGFVGIIDDKLPREEHERMAREALELVRITLESGKYKLVILDELNVAISLGLVSIEKVEEALDRAPRELNLVITGRDAHERLIERADLVTEMKEIKHPYQKGILAKKGIDF